MPDDLTKKLIERLNTDPVANPLGMLAAKARQKIVGFEPPVSVPPGPMSHKGPWSGDRTDRPGDGESWWDRPIGPPARGYLRPWPEDHSDERDGPEGEWGAVKRAIAIGAAKGIDPKYISGAAGIGGSVVGADKASPRSQEELMATADAMIAGLRGQLAQPPSVRPEGPPEWLQKYMDSPPPEDPMNQLGVDRIKAAGYLSEREKLRKLKELQEP